MRLGIKISLAMCGLVLAILLVPGESLAESLPGTPASPLTSSCAAGRAAMTPANLAISVPAPIELAQRPCCLDEWQGGGICPSGQRVASYCSNPGCENCGTFFCYSGLCYQ